MALLCNHVMPQTSGDNSSGVAANDNENSPTQSLGAYWNQWGQRHGNECVLITNIGTTVELGNIASPNYYHDQISAIRVRPGYRITLYEHSERRGREQTFPNVGGESTGQNFNLHDGNKWFNDITSSVYLEYPRGERELIGPFESKVNI